MVTSTSFKNSGHQNLQELIVTLRNLGLLRFGISTDPEPHGYWAEGDRAKRYLAMG